MKLSGMFWPLDPAAIAKRHRLKSKPKKPRSRILDQESIDFDGVEVKIRRYAYRRRVNLTLSVSGRMRVSAPMTLPMASILAFLEANRAWIHDQLAKFKDMRSEHPQKEYREGEVFPYMGRKIALTYRLGGSLARAIVEGDQLVVTVPSFMADGFQPQEPHPEFATLIRKLYEVNGRGILTQRLQIFSERMGLRPESIAFRSQKTRWGSCSSRRKISLNWKLVFAPVEVMDYVVIHELSHLKHYDHSAAFWSLVATESPRCRELRAWLRVHQYDADFLSKKSELY